jgi:NAD(P)-dependent dehydrogenase (short-subunit alcohol dehydrogenase family)
MKVSELFDVSNLSVVVTGAASGIGLGYAEVMAANGARVTMIDVNAIQLDSAVKKLRQEGAKVSGVVADVTQPKTLRTAIDATIEREQRIDVVFANAGISAGPGFLAGDGSRNPAGAFENLSPEMLDRALATNLGGAFHTIQAVVPQLKRQGGGRIIVTTTVAVYKVGTLVSTLYVASKAGLLQLVRQVALELARYGILVNGIAPGPVITNIGGGRLQDASARAPFERAIPMHRLATPKDIQGAALFLASSASNYITGTQIVIDGGGSLGTAD